MMAITGALDGTIGCQFGAGASIGVLPVPNVTEPGLPGLAFSGLSSMAEGVLWQVELNIKIAAATANPPVGVPLLLAFLPLTPIDFMNDVFLQPYLSGITQPIPQTSISFGPISGLPIPETDNNNLIQSSPELYGTGSSWESQISDFMKLFVSILAMPFMIFWAMVESLFSDPLAPPPLPSKSGLEDIFTDIAIGQGLDPMGAPAVGKLGGCVADGMISLV